MSRYEQRQAQSEHIFEQAVQDLYESTHITLPMLGDDFRGVDGITDCAIRKFTPIAILTLKKDGFASINLHTTTEAIMKKIFTCAAVANTPEVQQHFNTFSGLYDPAIYLELTALAYEDEARSFMKQTRNVRDLEVDAALI